MANNYCIMRISKMHDDSNVSGAISHHLRMRDTPNADPDKTKENWTNIANNKLDSKETKKIAMARYRALLPEKVRKNGVRAVEIMMTVSPEVLQRKNFKTIDYLNNCNKWAIDKFGSENVFFITHHLDEKTPHVHILLTPKDENGKLNARKFFGGREKMSALQDDFYQKVGKKYELDRGMKGSKATHTQIKKYYSKIHDLDVQIDLPKRKLLETDKKYRERAKSVLQPVVAPLLNLENFQKAKNKEVQEKADFYKNAQKTVLTEQMDLNKKILEFQTKKANTERELEKNRIELVRQEDSIIQEKTIMENAKAYAFRIANHDFDGARACISRSEQAQQSKYNKNDRFQGRGR